MNEAISNELVAENSVSGVKELIKLIKDNNDLISYSAKTEQKL